MCARACVLPQHHAHGTPAFTFMHIQNAGQQQAEGTLRAVACGPAAGRGDIACCGMRASSRQRGHRVLWHAGQLQAEGTSRAVACGPAAGRGDIACCGMRASCRDVQPQCIGTVSNGVPLRHPTPVSCPICVCDSSLPTFLSATRSMKLAICSRWWRMREDSLRPAGERCACV